MTGDGRGNVVIAEVKGDSPSGTASRETECGHRTCLQVDQSNTKLTSQTVQITSTITTTNSTLTDH